MWTRSPIYLFASCFLRRDASTAPTFSQRSFPPLSLSIPPPFVSPFSNDARFRTSAFPHLETFLEYFKLLLVLTHIFERKYFSRIVFNNIGREKNKQFKKRILIKKIYIYEYKEINIYSCHLIIFLVENFSTKINSNSSIPSNVEKKERKKFLLNFYLCFWPLGSLYAMLHFLSSSPFAVPLPPCRKCILARLLAAAWNADGETHKTTIHLHPAPPFFSPLRHSSVSSQNLSLLASPSALWPFTRVFELVFGSYLLRYATPVSSRSFARLDPVKVFPRQRYGNTVEESKIIGPVSLFITREKFLWNVRGN